MKAFLFLVLLLPVFVKGQILNPTQAKVASVRNLHYKGDLGIGHFFEYYDEEGRIYLKVYLIPPSKRSSDKSWTVDSTKYEYNEEGLITKEAQFNYRNGELSRKYILSFYYGEKSQIDSVHIQKGDLQALMVYEYDDSLRVSFSSQYDCNIDTGELNSRPTYLTTYEFQDTSSDTVKMVKTKQPRLSRFETIIEDYTYYISSKTRDISINNSESERKQLEYKMYAYRLGNLSISRTFWFFDTYPLIREFDGFPRNTDITFNKNDKILKELAL